MYLKSVSLRTLRKAVIGLVACIHGGEKRSDSGKKIDDSHRPASALLDETIYFSQYVPDVEILTALALHTITDLCLKWNCLRLSA